MSIISLSDSLANTKSNSSVQKVLNIIEFAEHPQFLGIKLFPVQRFLLKLMFNIPLSDNISDDPIILRDKFNEIIEHTFTSEIEFMHFLYREDRINRVDFLNISNVYLICGRRASKTTLTSVISTYTLYLVLSHQCPQDYFGILRSSEISVSICSNNKKNANKNMREIQTLVSNAPFFKPFITKNNISHSGSEGAGLAFRTKHEIATGHKIGDIIVATFAANPSVRGSNNLIAIMDEYAHFNDSEMSTKDKPLDKLLWEALTPSTSGFLHPDGVKAGKNIVLTSPNGKKGEVWSKRQSSKESPSTMFINLPSWWMNPKIASDDLKNEFRDSEMSYRQEYGAEFISKSSSAIGSIDKFYAQVDLRIPNVIQNQKRRAKFFVGIDQAFSGDAFSVAVCHFEPKWEREHLDEKYKSFVTSENVIVFDYIGRMQSDGSAPLQVDDVLDWVQKIVMTFPVTKGAYDQWSSELFGYVLAKKGIRGLGVLPATQISNDRIARTFKVCLSEGRIAFPNFEEFIEECMLLTEKLNGKLIKIENTSGHDDQYSAMSKALHFCYSHHISKNMDDIKVNDSKQNPTIHQHAVSLNNKMVLGLTSKFNGIRL